MISSGLILVYLWLIILEVMVNDIKLELISKLISWPKLFGINSIMMLILVASIRKIMKWWGIHDKMPYFSVGNEIKMGI
jgi:hypothetical protein